LISLSGGEAVTTNQVLYNLSRRGIEYDLLPWCGTRQIPVMAYSPIEQGKLLDHPDLLRIAECLDATPAQVALAWTIRRGDVVAIPKAGIPEHLQENYAALELTLSGEDIAALDSAFPPPTRARPLDVI
jgi:diketogulonate reductase-like aldo/keto reductase